MKKIESKMSDDSVIECVILTYRRSYLPERMIYNRDANFYAGFYYKDGVLTEKSEEDAFKLFHLLYSEKVDQEYEHKYGHLEKRRIRCKGGQNAEALEQDFLDKKLPERGLIISCSHNETVEELYPYVTEISLISDIIREYIDTPLADLLSHDFEADDLGITDILKASDRRIGKRRRAEYFKDTDNEAVKKILRVRGEI